MTDVDFKGGLVCGGHGLNALGIHGDRIDEGNMFRRNAR